MNDKRGGLTASDFPGIDRAKFDEWKSLKIKRNSEQRTVLYIGVGILLILGVLSVLTAKPYFLLIFLVLLFDDLFVFHRRRSRRLRQLGEELKMSDRLRAKRKGLTFTG